MIIIRDVIPAQTGIHYLEPKTKKIWIPTFVGMTERIPHMKHKFTLLILIMLSLSFKKADSKDLSAAQIMDKAFQIIIHSNNIIF